MYSKRNHIVFLLVLVFISSGCDSVYRMLDKNGAEEKELVGEAMPFEKNPTIEEIQTLLQIYGYSPGKIDGLWGLRTRNAIENFQRDQGLETTRLADKETWNRLNIFVEKGLIVNGELNISLIQTLLKNAGCSPGASDGNLGVRTKMAIVSFQRKSGLHPDGKIGYKTLSKLAEFLPVNEIK